MRGYAVVVLMGLVVGAGSMSGTDAVPGVASTSQSERATQPQAVAPGPTFAGVWQACDDVASTDACSRYALQQRGERICGVWSYVASGREYEGRVVAEALSPHAARRIRVCGRPGSETRTECDAGWEVIDKPLQLCDGKLGDRAEDGGACVADFERATAAAAEVEALSAQPWMQACLSGAD